MPTYEYECTRCGTVTEVYQSITAPARRRLKKEDCPQCDCHAPVVRRIGKGAGIIFKGSGFYETDYRSDSYKKAAKADRTKADGKKSDGDTKESKAEGTTTDSSKKKAPSPSTTESP